jgi:hypothetical protein
VIGPGFDAAERELDERLQQAYRRAMAMTLSLSALVFPLRR